MVYLKVSDISFGCTTFLNFPFNPVRNCSHVNHLNRALTVATLSSAASIHLCYNEKAKKQYFFLKMDRDFTTNTILSSNRDTEGESVIGVSKLPLRFLNILSEKCKHLLQGHKNLSD